MNYLYVMIGGALGALLRYEVSRLCMNVNFLSLPLGTLVVNLVGCFVLGLLTAIGLHNTTMPKELMLMLTTGMCGAFTTFSTFSGETVKMMANGNAPLAILYVVVSLVAGFQLYWGGFKLAD